MIEMIVIVCIANFLGALTGFGGVTLALPALVPLIGMGLAKNILLITGTFQPLYLTYVLRKHIRWDILKTIFLMCAVTLPLGAFLYDYLPQKILMIALGCTMVFAGITGILKLRNIPVNITSKPLLLLILFMGGLIEGALLTGGALMVIYATYYITDKTEFRATLSLLWVATHIVILAYLNTSVSYDSWKLSLITLPFLLISVFLANALAKKISQKIFSYLVNITLFVGGIITIFSQ